MTGRPRWSDRRLRTLAGLATGAVVFGLGALLPDEWGVTSLFLGALFGFLLVVTLVVFVVVPGPGTLRALLWSTPLAGACLVVAVLLLLSAASDLRPLWWTGVVLAAAWTAVTLWGGWRQGE